MTDIGTMTIVRAGTAQPSIIVSSVVTRPICATTGRIRSVSLITASRYSVSPASTDATSFASTAGLRVSRSNAHAIDVAVVSWPAESIVTSWSRSSSSVIGRPSSSRASSSIDMRSPDGSASGAACACSRRRSAISAWMSASNRSSRRRKRP